jgi:hypothetical protein
MPADVHYIQQNHQQQSSGGHADHGIKSHGVIAARRVR